MAGILTMGHLLKTNTATEKIRLEKGYSVDDIPILESFSLFKDGKPVEDFHLSNDDYNTFLTWLSKGPAKPIPDVGIKVLCFYKQKLMAGIKSFSITDGSRQKQTNLINTIDEMLKGGDDTQMPAAICAKGGAPPTSGTGSGTVPTSECCDSIKGDIETIKTFITGIQAGTTIATGTGPTTGASGECTLDDATKAQLTDIKTVVDSIPGLINGITVPVNPGPNPVPAPPTPVDMQPILDALQHVAGVAQSTEDKTATILVELAKAQHDIQAILARPAAAAPAAAPSVTPSSAAAPNALANLQVDYDVALAKAEEAGTKAAAAEAKLTQILANQTASSAEIQAAVEEATKAKIEVEKNLAIAQYIYQLDSESSTAIPVAPPATINPPHVGGAQVGGKRNKKTPANADKVQQAQSKLSGLNSAINAGWRKLRIPSSPSSPTDPTNPQTPTGPSPNISGANTTDFKRQLQAKNARIAELSQMINSRTASLKMLTNSVGSITGTVATLSAIVAAFVKGSSEMIAALKQKISLVPGSGDIKAQLDAILKRVNEVGHPDQSGQSTHTDADFAKMKIEYETEISRLGDAVEEKTTLYERALREIEELEHTVGERDERISELEGELRTKDARIAELEHEMAIIKQELERVKGELEECLRRPVPVPNPELEHLRALILEKEGIISDLTAQLRDKTVAFEEMQTARQSIEHDLSVIKTNLQMAQQQVTEKGLEIMSLESQRKIAEDEHKRNISTLKLENEQNTSRILALESERNKLIAEIERLQTETNGGKFSELQAQLARALQDLEEEHGKMLLLKTQIQAYEAEKADQLTLLEAERAAKSLAQQQLAALRTAFDASGDEIELLKHQIAENTAQIAELTEALASDASKKAFAAQIAELNATIGKHVATIQEVQEELVAVNASKSEKELEISRLKSLLVSKDGEISAYKQKIEEYKRGISDAVEEIKLIKKLLSYTLSIITETNKQLSDPRLSASAFAEQERKISELERGKVDLQAKIDALEFDIADKRAQIHGLDDEKAALAKNLAKRNLNISGLSSDLLEARTNASSAKSAAAAQKEQYETTLAEKKAQYQELLESSGEQTTLITSLKGQLAAALAQAAANEVSMKTCGLRVKENEAAQGSIQEQIGILTSKIQLLEAELLGLQGRHASNISGRNMRIKELEELAAIPKDDKEANGLRELLLGQEETSAAEKAALLAAKTEAEQRLHRVKQQFGALQKEHGRLSATWSKTEAEIKQKDQEIVRLSSELAQKTKEVELNLVTIKENQELIARLQQSQGTELQDLQQRYKEQVLEMHRSHEEAFNKGEQIKQLTLQLQAAEQSKTGATGLQEELKNLTRQQSESEAKYRQELEGHRATKAELARKAAECVQTDEAIRRQLQQAHSDLETMRTTLAEKQTQIQGLMGSKGQETSASVQKIAEKEREISSLRANMLVLETRISSCEGSSQLASTYLSQIANLKRTVDELTRERDKLKNTFAPNIQQRFAGIQEPVTNTRFARNFPGSYTPRKNDRKNALNKTIKLSRMNQERENFQRGQQQQRQPIRSAIEMAANRDGLAQRIAQRTTAQANSRFDRNFPGASQIHPVQPIQPIQPSQETGTLTEKNFPGLVKIRNSALTSKLSRINRERQEWQKTHPHLNLQRSIGGTRKNGKPWSGTETMTILPKIRGRKGARLAKSKRSIHPLN